MEKARDMIIATMSKALREHDSVMLDQAAGMAKMAHFLGAITINDLANLNHEIIIGKRLFEGGTDD